MSALLARFREIYGSRPLHLLTMLAGFALLGYIVVTAGPATLGKPEGAWWQSMAVWFAAAIIAHDLVLFPIYSLADRFLDIPKRRGRREPRVPARNYLRVPALGSGLLLLIFFPDIIRQGAPLYLADTGLTQQPFLGRWLLLTAAMFTTSALIYATRLALAHRRTTTTDDGADTATASRHCSVRNLF
jgi:hypothetical protein